MGLHLHANYDVIVSIQYPDPTQPSKRYTYWETSPLVGSQWEPATPTFSPKRWRHISRGRGETSCTVGAKQSYSTSGVTHRKYCYSFWRDMASDLIMYQQSADVSGRLGTAGVRSMTVSETRKYNFGHDRRRTISLSLYHCVWNIM